MFVLSEMRQFVCSLSEIKINALSYPQTLEKILWENVAYAFTLLPPQRENVSPLGEGTATRKPRKMQIHVICLRFSVGVLRHQSKQQLVASSFPNQRPIFSCLFYYSVFADNFVRFAKYRNRQISQIQP